MAIIIKSHKDTLLIDSTIGINYNSGNVLQGEKDMYERIVRACKDHLSKRNGSRTEPVI